MSKRKSKNRMYRDIQFEKIAKAAKLSYSYKDEFGVINFLKDFSLFRNFSANSITNILEDKTELYESSFRVFDFQSRVPGLDEEEVYNQTVFFVQSKKLALLHFYMEPGRSLKMLEKPLGTEKTNFNNPPPFSNEFWLNGIKEGDTRKAMSEDLLDYFSLEKDWTIEGLNYFMILYRKKVIIPTTDLMELFQKGKEMVKMFSESTRQTKFKTETF